MWQTAAIGVAILAALAFILRRRRQGLWAGAAARKAAFVAKHGASYGYATSPGGAIDAWRPRELPALRTGPGAPGDVYLDYAGAALPTRTQLVASLDLLGNPHASGGPAAERAAAADEKARALVLRHLNARAHDVVWTSGATAAIRAVAELKPCFRRAQKRPFSIILAASDGDGSQRRRGPRRGHSVEASRGDAVAGTLIFRGGESRRRRGPRRGYSVEASRAPRRDEARFDDFYGGGLRPSFRRYKSEQERASPLPQRCRREQEHASSAGGEPATSSRTRATRTRPSSAAASSPRPAALL